MTGLFGSGDYVTNNIGDVHGRDVDGRIEQVEPESFGWVAVTPKGKTNPELRRSLDQVQTLPGFTVAVEPGPQFVPGLRPARSIPWLKWRDHAAPPAAAESKGGVGGTLGYYDRLSDAFGEAVHGLSTAPDRSPFLVHDFIGGRRFIIRYEPPPLQPGGVGLVYVLDDGEAFKIGHTRGYVAARVASLQTGNPRLIRTVATVGPATDAVEAHLHTEFARWNRRGEWFDRQPVLELVDQAGGWEELLRRSLPGGNWIITVLP